MKLFLHWNDTFVHSYVRQEWRRSRILGGINKYRTSKYGVLSLASEDCRFHSRAQFLPPLESFEFSRAIKQPIRTLHESLCSCVIRMDFRPKSQESLGGGKILRAKSDVSLLRLSISSSKRHLSKFLYPYSLVLSESLSSP